MRNMLIYNDLFLFVECRSIQINTQNSVFVISRSAVQVCLSAPVKSSAYLKRWGFTPQKPTKRAYEQDPKRLEQWLANEYPEIAARAKEAKAEIHGGDETGIDTEPYVVKGFTPKGKTPVIRLHAKRSSINMISAITKSGQGAVHAVQRDDGLQGAHQVHGAINQGQHKKSFPHS